jgi:hypothetical protein
MMSCSRGKYRAASGSKITLFTALIAAMLSVPLVTAPGTATAEPYYKLTQALSPGGNAITAFDIIETNPILGLVAFSDKGTTGIDVFSTLNNQFLYTLDGFVAVRPTCTIPGTTTACDSGPNGTIFVDNTQLWGGDGNSTVRVFDIASKSLVTVITIPNGTPYTRSDEGCYDPINKVVEIHNDRDGFITFIAAPGNSAPTYTVLSQIFMNGTVNNGSGLVAPHATNGIEQCRWNPRNGLIYLNIPQVNGTGVSGSAPGAVLVINAATRSIVNSFTPPLSSCVNPTGMAIGPAIATGNHQILLACAAAQAVCQPVCVNSGPTIIDDTSGAVIANFPNDGGADEIYYDPGNGKYFLAESGAIPSQIGNIDAFSFISQPISLNAPIGTSSGTHTVAVDPILNQVYLPIANTPAAQSLHLCSSVGGNDALGCLLVFTTDSAPTADVAAVLPNARTTTPNGTAVTAFATIINIGTVQATACSIALPGGTPATLTYQTTNPTTNALTGTANTAANINAGQSQSFMFAVTPTQTLSENLNLKFACTNTAAAPIYPGLNTFQVTAASAAIPDMLSIAATTDPGNVDTVGLMPGMMMTATMNIAAAGTVTFTPTDTPPGEFPRGLPVTLTICQVNASAMCLATPTPSVTLAVTGGQVLMFAVTVTPIGGDPKTVPYIPAYNRIFLVATTDGGTPVGMTSAALKMQ